MSLDAALPRRRTHAEPLPGGGTASASLPFGASLSVLRNLDYLLVALVLGMSLFGIYSLAGAVNGVPGLASAADRQLAWFWIALAVMMVATLVDYRWINRAAVAMYLFNIVMLVAVLVIGSRINGARSWLSLGPLNFQPSETMKIATALVCAQWLSLRPEDLRSWKGIIVPGLICGFPAMLILMQPDLGTASLFFLIFLATTIIAGASKRRIGLIILAALIGMASAYPFLKTYQKNRIMVFLNPEADPTGAGYNVIQSKIAIGNGGLLGRGWGEGTQGVHRFLPEHHTDFIFASTVEQFGLLGGLLVLAGFLAIVWRMLVAMDRAKDRFGGIVVAGLAAVFCGHVVQNVSMTMGLVPVTGIPLPFLSYGGSFLVSVFLMFGLVLNVSSRRFTFIRV